MADLIYSSSVNFYVNCHNHNQDSRRRSDTINDFWGLNRMVRMNVYIEGRKIFFTFRVNSKHFSILEVENVDWGVLKGRTVLLPEGTLQGTLHRSWSAVVTWWLKTANEVILIIGSILRKTLFRNIFYTKFPHVPFDPIIGLITSASGF